MIDIESIIRKLARDTEWLILYARSKDLNIKLFVNDIDFTQIQIKFLYWLETYYNAYINLNLNDEMLSKYVINDDIRFDSYLLYKNKVKTSQQNIKDKQTENISGIPSIVFSKPSKR